MIIDNRRTGIGKLLASLWLLRGPIVATAVTDLVLTVAPQILELYRVLADGRHAMQAAFAVIFAIGASVCSWWLCRFTVATTAAQCPRTPRVQNFALTWTPWLLAVSIPSSTVIGVFLATKSITSIPIPLLGHSRSLIELQSAIFDLGHSARWARGGAAVFAVLAIASGLLAFVWARRSTIFSGDTPPVLRHPGSLLLSPIVTLALISFVVAFFPGFAASMGAVGMVLLFCLWLMFTLTAWSLFYELTEFPLMACVFGLSAIFSWLGWNNNHVVQLRRLPEPKDLWRPGGPEVFAPWLATRGDAQFYTDQGIPYPVLIVAARGGGSYAAAQAALFLANMQDRCPTFSQHIFAISGVSGGSIGATVYAAYAADHIGNVPWRPCEFGSTQPGETTAAMLHFARSDLLSSLLGSALFSDMFQRLLPHRVHAFDRGLALETAIDQSMNYFDSGTARRLDQDFLDNWRSDGAAPALLINTTEEETGRRRVISPFAVSPSREPGITWFYDPPGIPPFYRGGGAEVYQQTQVHSDVSLSAAAAMSARFPWILPAATLQLGHDTVHLVDGGYFDNSGIETALDLIEMLNPLRAPVASGEYSAKPKSPSYAIYLLIIDGAPPDHLLDQPHGGPSSEEVLAPCAVD